MNRQKRCAVSHPNPNQLKKKLRHQAKLFLFHIFSCFFFITVHSSFVYNFFYFTVSVLSADFFQFCCLLEKFSHREKLKDLCSVITLWRIIIKCTSEYSTKNFSYNFHCNNLLLFDLMRNKFHLFFC